MEAEQAAPVRRRVLRRYSAGERERLVKEQKASGQSRRDFCAERGINLGTFRGWFKTRHKAPDGFAEVELPVGVATPIEIHLPNGARIGIRQQGTREELIALIRGVTGMDTLEPCKC